jgi:hypothetical protein
LLRDEEVVNDSMRFYDLMKYFHSGAAPIENQTEILFVAELYGCSKTIPGGFRIGKAIFMHVLSGESKSV